LAQPYFAGSREAEKRGGGSEGCEPAKSFYTAARSKSCDEAVAGIQVGEARARIEISARITFTEAAPLVEADAGVEVE
jgi:hypothetical protein